MNNPTGTPQADGIAAALKAALSAPNMQELLLPTRAAAAKIFTPDEAMNLAANMANALDRSPRLPIHTAVTRNPDGTMTIHVTPTTPA